MESSFVIVWMDIQDFLVLVVLFVLIAYDVIDFFKFRQNIQEYRKNKERTAKEKYPQNNMKEFLPPARKYDKVDVITTTQRYCPKTKRN